MANRMYQSYQGPTDPSLTHSLIEGYQPVSRIGEVVINSFVDSYEFTALPETIKVKDVSPTEMAKVIDPALPQGIKDKMEEENDRVRRLAEETYEFKPHFHEW